MKTPRGYKKRYFTLAAIQATVCQCKLRALVSRLVMMGLLMTGFRGLSEDDEEDLADPPPNTHLILTSVFQPSIYSQSSSPCRCNRIFTRKTRCTLALSAFLRKICPCRKRKSGLSPPPHNRYNNHYSF